MTLKHEKLECKDCKIAMQAAMQAYDKNPNFVVNPWCKVHWDHQLMLVDDARRMTGGIR
jgi:hypothetical protein